MLALRVAKASLLGSPLFMYYVLLFLFWKNIYRLFHRIIIRLA